jgi:hypothetical protein
VSSQIESLANIGHTGRYQKPILADPARRTILTKKQTISLMMDTYRIVFSRQKMITRTADTEVATMVAEEVEEDHTLARTTIAGRRMTAGMVNGGPTDTIDTMIILASIVTAATIATTTTEGMVMITATTRGRIAKFFSYMYICKLASTRSH